MTASLIAAGYELIANAAGTAGYHLQAGGLGLGDGEPDTTVIASLLLDGDPVTGNRTKNRHGVLPVKVIGTSRLDLSARVDTLRAAVNAATWTLQYTPDGGLPIVFDCFRATVTHTRPTSVDGILETVVTLSFDAMPFGRSPDQKTITVAARSQIDSFDTAPSGAALDTTTKIEGTGSAKVTGNQSVPNPNLYTPTTPISRSFAARDYSAYPNVAVQALAPYPPGSYSILILTLTLTSASGSTTYAPVSVTFNAANWRIASIPLTGGTVTSGSGVTLTAVTSYSLSTTLSYILAGQPASLTWNIDDLEATGSSAALTTTTRGELLLIPAIIGSARTPVSIAATGTIKALLVHRPPVDEDANLQTLTGVTVAASPSTPAASTIAANNAHYAGTYAALLGVSTVGAAGSNTVSVVVTQLENGVAVATATLTATYTSPLPDFLVKLKDALGNDLTLPLRAVPADNTLTTYTFAFNHSAGADAYSDFMLCDTRGQRVIVYQAASVAAIYLDRPPPTATYGGVYASASGRSMAYGIIDTADIGGGPMIFDPGNDRLMVWSDAAAPAITITYYPEWQDERAA